MDRSKIKAAPPITSFSPNEVWIQYCYQRAHKLYSILKILKENSSSEPGTSTNHITMINRGDESEHDGKWLFSRLVSAINRSQLILARN